MISKAMIMGVYSSMVAAQSEVVTSTIFGHDWHSSDINKTGWSDNSYTKIEWNIPKYTHLENYGWVTHFEPVPLELGKIYKFKAGWQSHGPHGKECP